jgi:hypothetical protein
MTQRKVSMIVNGSSKTNMSMENGQDLEPKEHQQNKKKLNSISVTIAITVWRRELIIAKRYKHFQESKMGK